MGGAVSVKNKPVKSFSTENYMLQQANVTVGAAKAIVGKAAGASTAIDSASLNEQPKIKRSNSESSIRCRRDRGQLSMSFKAVAEQHKYNHELSLSLTVDPAMSPASTASVNTISPANIGSMKKEFSFNHPDFILDHQLTMPEAIQEEREEALIDCIADAFASHQQQQQEGEGGQDRQQAATSTAHERHSPVIMMNEEKVIEEARSKFFQTLEIVKRRRSSIMEQQSAAAATVAAYTGMEAAMR